MNTEEIGKISGICHYGIRYSQIFHYLVLFMIVSWTTYVLLDVNVTFILMPMGLTMACLITFVYMLEEDLGIYSPLKVLKVYRFKKYKHFRQLIKLNDSHSRLQKWLYAQERSKEKRDMYDSLDKFETFIKNGFKMDYLARMNNEIKNDIKLLNIKVFDDFTYEDVENYLINGIKDTTEMDRIYAELDQKFGIEK